MSIHVPFLSCKLLFFLFCQSQKTYSLGVTACGSSQRENGYPSDDEEHVFQDGESCLSGQTRWCLPCYQAHLDSPPQGDPMAGSPREHAYCSCLKRAQNFTQTTGNDGNLESL